MIDTRCQSIINTAVGEHFSSENRHSGTVEDEVIKYNHTLLKPLNKFVEQVILPEVSNLNESIMNKN